MRVTELLWKQQNGWQYSSEAPKNADLVLYFGSREGISSGARYRELKEVFPTSHIMGCSTGGQIRGNDVSDDDVAAVAMQFDKTKIRLACEHVSDSSQSSKCGQSIGNQLADDNLKSVFVLSDGLNVNGSDLVSGLNSAIRRSVTLTGGLAGDGSKFERTLVGADFEPRSNVVAAIGFYGDSVQIGHGSAGGWDVFGPHRKITKSQSNVLFELDGKPALDLYEAYLGADEIAGLPGTALLFPIQISDPQRPGHTVVRTILGVDKAARSMTFAGDLPQGWGAQLMRGNYDNLANGAGVAARQASAGQNNSNANNSVAILISCIGRRLLMGQRTGDELEAAGSEMGSQMPRIGFYSYGELSPHSHSGACELHNQTMTITTISEAA